MKSHSSVAFWVGSSVFHKLIERCQKLVTIDFFLVIPLHPCIWYRAL